MHHHKGGTVMKGKFCSLLVLITACVGAAHAADTPAAVDKMKAAVTPGEFVITGTETKTIHEAKVARAQKVCVKKEKEAASLKLTYDGQQAVLTPGECKTISAKKMEATPEHPLTDGAHIVVTVHRIK
jgi:hypothetical protein